MSGVIFVVELPGFEPESLELSASGILYSLASV
jgi:HSP20 family molecular chaperone IbpA